MYIVHSLWSAAAVAWLAVVAGKGSGLIFSAAYHLRVTQQIGEARDPPGPTGVCMLTGELPPDHGGVGDYTARLSDALAALGVPVGILTRRHADRPVRRVLGASQVPVHGIVPAWDARAWPLVLRVLRQLGPRPLLHIQFQAGAFELGGSVHLLPSLVRAALPRARVVTTFHDFLIPYLFPKAGPLRLAANQHLARTSHAAIFTDLGDLERAGAGVRGRVVPIGSNVDREPATEPAREDLRRLLGADDRTLLVGYFGFLNPSKGVPTLLEAIGKLAAERPVKLALIGADVGVSNPTDLGQARAVHDAIEQQHLGETVVRTGYLPPPDLSATLLACDVIALPFSDGASARRGTLMAALAHGLPIVSTLPARHSGLAGAPAFWLGTGPGGVAVRDGESILLVPPDDPAALAAALARLADDPDLRVRLAVGARAVAERISWPMLAAETREVYASTFVDQDS
jgi:glycosyltransferase involved in cell wall biosynthesis